MNLKDQLQSLAQKFQAGGQVTTDWKTKYSSNQYFKDREDWGEKLDNKFPNAKNTVRESVYQAARRTGIDPGLLYTSAMEEGMKLALNGKDTGERRAGYVDYKKNNPKSAEEYPIDGGYYYGLNTFSDKYGKTIKPSNLPRGFKYTPYPQKGEDGKVAFNSAAFRTHDDAISAKAAQMKQVQESMNYKIRDSKIDLTPEARKFFDMVGYNMGEEKTIEMIKSYQQKGYLKDDRFLDQNFQPASWKEPYTNVQRRYQNYRILNEQGYFKDYDTPNPKVAVTGSTKEPDSFQVGGEVDTLDGTKEWWTRYINSPKYRERLQKEFPKYSESEIESELNSRKLNLDRTYPIVGEGHFKDPSILGSSLSPEEDQRINPSIKGKFKNFMEDYVVPSSRPVYIKDGTDTDTYTHEISHSVDEGGRRIPIGTVANILKRVRGVEPIEILSNDDKALTYDRVKNESTINALMNNNNFYGLNDTIDQDQSEIYPDINWKIGNDSTKYSPKFGYGSSPTEMIAKLQSVRKDMYNKGYHDSATEDITQDQLIKYLDETFESDKKINSDLEDLLDQFKRGDSESKKKEVTKNLEWMLNNIAKNNTKNKDIKYAQKGGIPNIGQLLNQKPEVKNVFGNIKLSQEQFEKNRINNQNRLNEKLNNTETANTWGNMLGNVNQYFLGNKDSSLQKSLYKPTINSDPKVEYYTRPGMRQDVYNDLISEKVRKDYNHTGEFEDIFTALKANGLDRPNNAKDSFPLNQAGYKGMYNKGHGSFKGEFNLGRYKIDAGEDENGKYISYNDVYDWNGSQTENKINFYDRIYEKDWNELKNKKKVVKKQSGGMIRSELENLALKYS